MNKFPFWLKIILAMILGTFFGFVLKDQAAVIGHSGSLIIDAIKIVAGPFLFFSILSALIQDALHKKDFFKLLGITSINAFFALFIGMGISLLLTPGRFLSPLTSHSANTSLLKTLPNTASTSNFSLPKSLFEPFLQNSIPSLVVLALVFGLAYRMTLSEIPSQTQNHISFFIQTMIRLFQKILSWLTAFIPLAVFLVITKTVGQHGLSFLKGLSVYLVVILLGLSLQIFLVYHAWLRFVGIKFFSFCKSSMDVFWQALGTSSSLATLPITLRVLTSQGVSQKNSNLAACIGTNLNNDGILLYEAAAALMVAQAYGYSLDLGQILILSGVCLVTALGITGVPEAGLISLSLVLSSVGLPNELIALLLSVDWILSRARAFTNVWSDLTVAHILERYSKKT